MKLVSLRTIVLLMILNTWLMAQSVSMQVTTTPEANAQQNWNLSLKINGLQNSNSGFVVAFPAKTVSLPVNVISGDQSFWLKQDSSTPTIKNVIHWQKSDSLIIFRLAKDAPVTNGTLEVFFNFVVPAAQTVNGVIRLFSLLPNGATGPLMQQTSLQFKPSVTR